MKCPFCGFKEDKVVDSRATQEEAAIRRRRECLKCGKRFTSYERVEDIIPMVVKKDGRREPFERSKVLSGLKKACEKRPIPINSIEEVEKNAARTLAGDDDLRQLAAEWNVHLDFAIVAPQKGDLFDAENLRGGAGQRRGHTGADDDGRQCAAVCRHS